MLPGFGVSCSRLDSGGAGLVGGPDLADPLHLAAELLGVDALEPVLLGLFSALKIQK